MSRLNGWKQIRDPSGKSRPAQNLNRRLQPLEPPEQEDRGSAFLPLLRQRIEQNDVARFIKDANFAHSAVLVHVQVHARRPAREGESEPGETSGCRRRAFTAPPETMCEIEASAAAVKADGPSLSFMPEHDCITPAPHPPLRKWSDHAGGEAERPNQVTGKKGSGIPDEAGRGSAAGDDSSRKDPLPLHQLCGRERIIIDSAPEWDEVFLLMRWLNFTTSMSDGGT